MRMTQHRREPRAQPIPIKTGNPIDEISLLSELLRNLNETTQSLWDTVHELRMELASRQPGAAIDKAGPRPPTWRLPPASSPNTVQIDLLNRQIDELHGDAEYLWFEAQWLRAQLASSDPVDQRYV